MTEVTKTTIDGYTMAQWQQALAMEERQRERATWILTNNLGEGYEFNDFMILRASVHMFVAQKTEMINVIKQTIRELSLYE